MNKLLRSIKTMTHDGIVNWIAAGVCCPHFFRLFIYKCFGNNLGRKCILSPRIFLGSGKGKMQIGGGTFINYGCFFDLGDDISIGKNCNVAMNVHFINSTHELGRMDRRAGKNISDKIVIGDGCWIGADSIIMPGINIGDGVVIGAGSLVTENCDSNCVYLGRPAKKVKELRD